MGALTNGLLGHNFDGVSRNLNKLRRVTGIRHLDVFSWFPSVGHHKECILVRLLVQNTLARFLTLSDILCLLFQFILLVFEKVHLSLGNLLFIVIILVLALGLAIGSILLAMKLLNGILGLIAKLIRASNTILRSKLKLVTNLSRNKPRIILVLRALFGFNHLLFLNFRGLDGFVIIFVVFETTQ